MASAIDATQPPRGAPLTQGCRDNFLAMRDEVEALQANAITGVIEMYSGVSAPEGWLLCQGQVVSNVNYPDLFDVIGTTYGSGSEPDEFALPDFRIRTPRHYALGATGGSLQVSLTSNNLPVHDHGGTDSTGSHDHGASTGTDGAHSHTYSVDSAGAHGHTLDVDNAGNHSHSGSLNTTGAHRHDATANGAGSANSYDTGHVALSDGSFSWNSAGAHSHSISTSTDGGHSHSLSPDNAGLHNHTVVTDSVTGHSHTTDTSGSHTHTTTAAGSGDAHNNVPASLALHFIIKT